MANNNEEIEVPIVINKQESLVDKVVPPHGKISREVKDEDAERVSKDAQILYDLCFYKIGNYAGAFAMHHSQIESEDPLNFFVTKQMGIIINPEIVKHSNYKKDNKEACMSFPFENQIMVKRWQKVTVVYQTLVVDKDSEKVKLSEKIESELTGLDSFVLQHEIDHGQGIFIYPLTENK